MLLSNNNIFIAQR